MRKFIAFLVVIASFYWLGQSFIQHGSQLQNWHPNTDTFVVLAVCSLIYGCNGFLLSAAWQRLLNIHGFTEKDQLQCHIIYSRTQIAKYLPGNVFHFAGRYALGREAGISKLALIGSTFYENFGVLSAAGIFSLVGLLVYQKTDLQTLAFGETLSHLIILLAILLALIIIFRMISLSKGLDHTPKKVLQLMSVGLFYLAFFLAFGVIASMVVELTSTREIKHWEFIIPAFSMAWITGFVTPGAPAGMGVREFTVVFLLSPLLGDVTSLLSALLFRLVTIVGDLLFFLSSFILSYYRSGNGSNQAT